MSKSGPNIEPFSAALAAIEIALGHRSSYCYRVWVAGIGSLGVLTYVNKIRYEYFDIKGRDKLFCELLALINC
jgi:hypothetical protein